MVLHSLNIFLVLNLLALRSLSGLPSLFLIYRSSLDKILLEDRCCFCFILSAMSNKDLQNRNLFPSSPLLPSMKIFPLSNKCFFWNYWLSATLSLSTLNSCFYLPSSLLHEIRVFNSTNVAKQALPSSLDETTDSVSNVRKLAFKDLKNFRNFVIFF